MLLFTYKINYVSNRHLPRSLNLHAYIVILERRIFNLQKVYIHFRIGSCSKIFGDWWENDNKIQQQMTQLQISTPKKKIWPVVIWTNAGQGPFKIVVFSYDKWRMDLLQEASVIEHNWASALIISIYLSLFPMPVHSWEFTPMRWPWQMSLQFSVLTFLLNLFNLLPSTLHYSFSLLIHFSDLPLIPFPSNMPPYTPLQS